MTRRYTTYTQELRDKAFAMFLENKSNWEIQKELNIGDSSGVSKIKKQDSWIVRRKLIQQNVQLASQTAVLKGANPTVIDGEKLTSAVKDYAERNAEILTSVKKISTICLNFIDKEDGGSPKSFNEAVHIWLESIRLERSIIGSTIEEVFIVQVFDILRNEINDIDLLRRIGVKLKSLLK